VIKMHGVRLDIVSKNRLSSMTAMEKIRLILDSVHTGKIIVLEWGLTPEEEAKLIEVTMSEITHDDFIGIEIESYPYQQKNVGFIGKLLGKSGTQPRLTVIGPANRLKTIKKDSDFISAIVSSNLFE